MKSTIHASSRRLNVPSLHAVFALMLCCLAVGCSATKAPAIRVVDASVVEATDEGAVVSFLLELENVNPQPLELREFMYAVQVNGRQVLDTRRSAEATLPQRSTYTVLLPAVIPYARYGGVPSGVLPCVLSGQLTYVAPGAFDDTLFDMEIRVPTTSFSGAQDVDFSVQQASAGQ